MPAKLKLTDEQVKRIRRRVRAGARVIDPADEFNVDRKTIWRRLGDLERAETERAQRITATRLRRQAAPSGGSYSSASVAVKPSPSDRLSTPWSEPDRRRPRETARKRNPFHEWLDTPKNLSGRARTEASGLVRVSNPEGTVRVWCERSEIDALFEAGWQLA